MNVRRFDFEENPGPDNDGGLWQTESAEGEWVRYADYAALLARMERDRNAVETAHRILESARPLILALELTKDALEPLP